MDENLLTRRQDPYFEHIPATRLDGTPNGKFKKRKKALPPGISKHDGQILTKVKRRAYRLDLALFSCCGIRFGWSSALGFIPGYVSDTHILAIASLKLTEISNSIGDVLDAIMALMVLRTCEQIEGGLPKSVKTKMMLNIMLDFGIGLVPFVGDLADAVFRANTRNAAILEQHLREQGKKALRSSGQPIPAIDPSDPDDFDRMQAEGPPEYVSRPPSRHEAMPSRPQDNASGSHRPMPAEPEPARVHENRWFFGRSKARAYDVERAEETRRSSRTQRQQRRDHR